MSDLTAAEKRELRAYCASGENCLSCKYPDCIFDELTVRDYREIRERDTSAAAEQALHCTYYEKNKKRILAHQRSYYEVNKARILEQQRANYEKNKERILAQSRAAQGERKA